MLPKRKFIKKQFMAPETDPTDDVATSVNLGDLVEQLKSTDNKIKADAVSAIANLQSIDSQIEQQMYSSSTLVELIKIISTEPSQALIQTALFALNNLCTCQTENNPMCKTVHTLFNIGLDKALMQINSSDAHLIKPILVLMGNIAEYIPKQHKYLLEGVQNNLVNDSQKYLSTQKYYDLVIQFLIKSNYKLFESPTAEQVKCIQLLCTIAETDKLYRNRAMASKLLTMMSEGKIKQHVQLFCLNFEQFMVDINLEAQYKNNIEPLIKQSQSKQQQEQDIQDLQQISHEQEQMAQNMMQEENKAKTKTKKSKSKRKGKNKEEQAQTQKPHDAQQEQTSYTMFMDALEGLQILLQFIVEQFQDQLNFDEEQDEEDEMQEEEQMEEIGQTAVYDKTAFLAGVNAVLTKVFTQFGKFTVLSFVEGQNIIELVLRMILALPVNFTIVSTKETITNVIMLVEQLIVHEFKLELKHPHRIPEQVFAFNLKTALQNILRYKLISNRCIYVDMPHLKYQSDQTSVMKINNKWKQCWIDLLEVYSLFYNPEKIPNVTQDENRKVGGALKHLIIQIPEIQLEEWRGQTIDTLFDVYSNQNFDTIFMQFGFLDILAQVLKVAGGGTNKFGGIKGKKSNKFINAVISDIQRFVAYKRKMIGI